MYAEVYEEMTGVISDRLNSGPMTDIHVYAYVCTQVAHVYAYTSTQVSAHVHTHLSVYVCIHVYTCDYAHAHAHVHTHVPRVSIIDDLSCQPC